MKMKKKRPVTLWPDAQGQSLVEFALVLPFLILLLLGVIEIGFMAFDYLSLSTANREGVRLASRARFTDAMVAERIVSSSGLSEQDDGSFAPNMRLIGPDANLGVIITHLSIDEDGTLISVTSYVSGTILGPGNVPRPLVAEDTHFTATEMATLIADSGDVTTELNNYRSAMSFDELSEEIVIVESFLTHEMWTSWSDFPVTNSMTLYFYSTMRVTRDSRQN